MSHATPANAPKPLVLLPGLLCDAAAWVGVSAGLAGLAKTQVIHCGARDRIEAMAEHVLACAPPGPFALAGHSMGGRVALEVIRRAPARIERLALLDTGFRGWPAGAAGEAEREGRFKLLTRARSEGMRAMGREWARGMVHPARLDTPVFDDILAMIERATPEMFAAQIQALLRRPDATAMLPRIACPTCLLCGREDAWSPLAQHAQMQALIRGSHLVVIESSGHMSTMERPGEVASALAEWLAREPE